MGLFTMFLCLATHCIHANSSYKTGQGLMSISEALEIKINLGRYF